MFGHPVERAPQVREEAPRPDVDDDSDLRLGVVLVVDELDHGLQQLRREVVDDEPPQVFEVVRGR